MKKKYILNTIAFKDKMASNVRQSELVKEVKKLGFDAIEIRNEFIRNPHVEFSEIAKEAQKNNLVVYYSATDSLIKNGKINTSLASYITQMKDLESRFLKMNIGNLKGMPLREMVDNLTPYLDGSFQLRVENNQVLADSNLQNTLIFLNEVSRQEQKNISFCFDIANWSWLAIDALAASDVFEKFTSYLHLKNVKRTPRGLETTSLEEGELNWRQIISKFNHVEDFGLEYSGDEKTIGGDLELIKQL